MSMIDFELKRAADALERIADALEGTSNRESPTLTPVPVTLTLDNKVLASSVIKYSLQRAARGPSSLVGGKLVDGKLVDGRADPAS